MKTLATADEYDDLRMRQPIDDKTLRRIDTLANSDLAWTEQDYHIMAGYAVSLLLEVKRLQLEVSERERELDAALKVVSVVEGARDRLAELQSALDVAVKASQPGEA